MAGCQAMHNGGSKTEVITCNKRAEAVPAGYWQINKLKQLNQEIRNETKQMQAENVTQANSYRK